MNSFELEGKIALVTGGASGIGLQIAKALNSAGAIVIIADIMEEAAEKATAELIRSGTEAMAVCTDVSAKTSVENLMSRIIDRYGRLDILVNSAGINIRKNFLEYDESEWDQILRINLKGIFLLCQAAGRLMVQQKSGKIINISSVLEKVGQGLRGPYAASKGGVAQLTKVLAIELAPHNVKVNCIAPGFIKTPLIASVMEKDPSFDSFVKSRVPMARVGNPEEVAGVVLFLSSELASYITGQSIFVDGGWTIS